MFVNYVYDHNNDVWIMKVGDDSYVVVGEYSILFYCNRKDHGDSRSITKTTPGCLEDRTRGSDQWEAEAGKC